MEVVKFYQTFQGHRRGSPCTRVLQRARFLKARRLCGGRQPLATSIKAQTNQRNEAGDHLEEDSGPTWSSASFPGNVSLAKL